MTALENMTRIAEHYNTLRDNAAAARKVADGTATSTEYHTLYVKAAARVSELATAYAAADFPRVCASLADGSCPLPKAPARFGRGFSQVTCTMIGTSRVYSDRSDSDGYASAAYTALRRDAFEIEAQAAEAEFEAYRRAVSQGVAVAPPEN